jgi:hypothetical protein
MKGLVRTATEADAEAVFALPGTEDDRGEVMG